MNIIDTLELGTINGFDIRAEIVADDTDYDEPVGDYPADVVQAWRENDWFYVGIIVTASRAGTDLGSDSIWAVAYGNIPGVGDIDPLRDKDGSLDYYRGDLIDNATAQAMVRLAEMNTPPLNWRLLPTGQISEADAPGGMFIISPVGDRFALSFKGKRGGFTVMFNALESREKAESLAWKHVASEWGGAA